MTQYGKLKIRTKRGGEVREIIQFLTVLENTYNNLYALEFIAKNVDTFRRQRYESPFPFRPSGYLDSLSDIEGLILPEDRLRMTSVVIESPGFWEFLGNLNPLSQIREYLKDRHERRQDIEYRERYERERLSLENERQRIENARFETELIRERIQLLEEAGFGPDEIRRLTVRHAFEPLRQLDTFTNNGLINESSVNELDI
jgi:hypothetical protein